MASATNFGSSGNPAISSYATWPDSPASLCTGHSSCSTVNGSGDFFQCSSRTSQNSCSKRNKQHSRVCRTRPELFNNRRTIGHEGDKLFRLFHTDSRQGFQGSQSLGVLTPAVMRIFVQKTIDTDPCASDRFPSTTSSAQSRWTSGLVGSLIARPSILHFGDPSKSNGLSVLKYSHKRSMFAWMSRSQQLRDMSKSSPGVKPMRLGVIAVLGWLQSPQCERHSDPDPAATSRKPRDLLRVHQGQQRPEIVRWASIQWLSFDLLAIRSRSNWSSKYSTFITSIDKSASALISAWPGKLPDSDIFTFFEPMRSSLSSGRSCSTEELHVAVLMTMVIHHNTWQVQALCVAWMSRMKQLQSRVQWISPFPCVVPLQTLNVTFFRALPWLAHWDQHLKTCLGWFALYTDPCDHAKAPESSLLRNQHIQKYIHIWSGRLNSWCTLDVAWLAPCWLEEEGQSAQGERQLATDNSPRPSFDSFANHAPSKCSDYELLRTFLDAQENTVQKFVRDLNLLVCFQIQDLLSPCCGHGSWMRHSLKSVPSALWSQRQEMLTWLAHCPISQSALGNQV